MKTNNNEMMNLIRGDFENLKNYFGCPDMEMPELNFVVASNDEANLKLGACKFTTFPVSMNEIKVKSMNILNIFVEKAKYVAEKLIGESDTYKATKFFIAYVRYSAIHELTHHIQMKLGMTITKKSKSNSEDAFREVLEEIETRCTESTVDFVKKHMRGEKIFEYLSQLDMCSLAEEFNKSRKEIIKETKEEVFNNIINLLNREEEAINEVQKC